MSLKDVAHLLGYQPKAVSYILYKLSAAQKYTIFEIPKKNGGQRTIAAPVDRLKDLAPDEPEVHQALDKALSDFVRGIQKKGSKRR